MRIWHLTPETPRTPPHLSAGEQATLRIGTYPIEAGQTVWVEVQVFSATGKEHYARVEAHWQRNDNTRAYPLSLHGTVARGNYLLHGSPQERSERCAVCQPRQPAALMP